MSMITHIVCDMGGVLVELQWAERVSGLLGQTIPLEEIHQLWSQAHSTVDFESGRLDFEQFAVAFIEEFSLEVTPAVVQREVLEFVQAPLPQCNQVLGQLKSEYHLSLLSNTNPAHYHRLRERYDFFDYFDQLFLSYEMGVMKPDDAIFQQVLSGLDVAPEKVAFFDDGIKNVEAAQRLGMQAYQVTTPAQILAALQA